jgi:TfoX/Sxy family transcriptional regulator of competence genes
MPATLKKPMPQRKRSPAKEANRADAAEGDVLAEKLRAALPAKGLSDRKMFGGIGFMINGNMIAGASKRGLLLRVGKERYREALARSGARPMEMRGRPVEGYVRIDAAGLTEAALLSWLALARGYVETLPPKAKEQSRRSKRD